MPLLKQVHTLSYAQAGALIMVMNLTSSVIQPLFGHLTDRLSLRWLVPVGVAVSGLSFGLIGLCPNYVALMAVVVFSGLGVASFHPEAFKGVLGSAGSRKVVGVSWFMVGGNAGPGPGAGDDHGLLRLGRDERHPAFRRARSGHGRAHPGLLAPT